MAKLPRLTADEFIKILTRLGFSEVRQEGSHKIFKNSTGVRVTVQHHRGKVLHPKIVKTFLRDVGLSANELTTK